MSELSGFTSDYVSRHTLSLCLVRVQSMPDIYELLIVVFGMILNERELVLLKKLLR